MGRRQPRPRIGLANVPLPHQAKFARKARDPPREVTILAVALGHPSLVEAHCEELAALEFSASKLAGLRDALLAAPPEALQSPETLADAVALAGRAEERERILALAAKMPNWWCLRPEASPADAALVLRQSLALHHRAGALNRELKLAERSLALEPNERNLARLLDIKTQLAELAHAEAATEGFGEQSGRGSTTI